MCAASTHVSPFDVRRLRRLHSCVIGFLPKAAYALLHSEAPALLLPNARGQIRFLPRKEPVIVAGSSWFPRRGAPCAHDLINYATTDDAKTLTPIYFMRMTGVTEAPLLF